MSNQPNSPSRNRLLALLPEGDREHLRPHLTTVDLPQHQVLVEQGQPLAYVYFPHSGITSHLVLMEDGTAVEAGLIGYDGLVGLPVVLAGPDTLSTHEVVMQVGGTGERIQTQVLWEMLESRPALRHVLLRYALAMLNQVARTSACNRLHSVEQRCARWLLQVHDRVDGDTFPLTHEYLAMMLGVRRPGVTLAAGALRQRGAITYSYGAVTVENREILESASCEDYRVTADEYRQMLG